MSLALVPDVPPGAAALTAVGYARISSDDTKRGLGVERQTDDILSVVGREGWSLSRDVITDNDFSASRYARKARPGFATLMALVRARAVDRVVVYNLDRLLRQPRELEDLIDAVEATGIVVVTLTGTLDLRTREGRMFARMQVAFAAGEADATHERLLKHYDQLAAQGRPKGVGRARAFGYEADGMTVRPDEAAAFHAAARDVLAGASLADIVRRWNAEGFTTPQAGKAFRSQTVKDILTNPRHAGKRVHRGTVVGDAAWPPLVSEADHEALKAKLNDPSRAQGPRGRRSAFAGLLRSPEGRALEIGYSQGRRRYSTRPKYAGEQVMSVTIGADFVEGRVLDLFFEAVDSGRLAARVADRRAAAKAAPVPTDDPVELERELETLARMKGSGDLSLGEWQAMRAPLKARLDAARKAREVDAGTVSERVLDDLVDLRSRWSSFTPDRQRAYLSAAFERITVHRASKPGRAAAGDVSRIEPVWRL